MAPSRRGDHSKDQLLSEELFRTTKYQAKVPAAFVSVKEAERNYGVFLEVCDILTEAVEHKP